MWGHVKRRWAWRVAYGVSLAACISAASWISTSALGGNLAAGGSMAAVGTVLRDPLALFGARSPGERGAGALLSSKPFGVDDREPVEQALATGPERPPSIYPLAGLPIGVEAPELTPLMLPGDLLPPMDPFSPELDEPVEDVPILVGPDLVVVVGGGDELLPPSQAPEPMTWAMMVLGFFALGASIRRAAAAQARLEP